MLPALAQLYSRAADTLIGEPRPDATAESLCCAATVCPDLAASTAHCCVDLFTCPADPPCLPATCLPARTPLLQRTIL
jgi:hypothetical protein